MKFLHFYCEEGCTRQMGKEKKFKLPDDLYFSLLRFKKSASAIRRIFLTAACYFIRHLYLLKPTLKPKSKSSRDEEYSLVSATNSNFHLNLSLHSVIHENFQPIQKLCSLTARYFTSSRGKER